MSQNNRKLSPSFVGMTMAITNMQKMLEFYSNVFGLVFEEKDLYNSKLYAARWGELDLLFCPAELAQNSAEQNRHQFDFHVADLSKVIEVAVQSGGSKMAEVVEDDTSLSVGIYDPDRNSILFKELKN